MNLIKKSIVLFTIASPLCLGTSLNTEAAPIYNKLTTLIQPDNTKVQVNITGDEYYQNIESPDGYTLCRNSEGWICYASLNSDKSDYVATDEIYTGNDSMKTESSQTDEKHLTIDKDAKDKKREEIKKELNPNSANTSSSDQPSTAFARSVLLDSPNVTSNSTTNTNTNLQLTTSSSSSTSTNITGLTVLINFPDQQSSISKDEINNFFNQSGYTGFSNNGSVRDYFYDVSGGKVTYTNTITEFYTAKHEKSYYDGVNISDYSTSQELINEALSWLQSTGFDFSTLTKDSNNNVQAVNFLYAGTADAGWSKGLWPHQGYLSSTFSANGVNIQKYELSDIGTDLSIGTICHENGHLLFGYPDLYDYNGQSNGCGTYSLMSYISDEKNPAPPDPYCRNIISGWTSPVSLNSSSTGSQISLNSDSNGNQTVYKWSGSNSNEYYLVDNIKKTGRYSAVPDEGLMIWHVDENGDNSNYAMTSTSHYKVSVVQADNKLELEKKVNYGADGDLFHAGSNSTFNDTSSPNSKWWNGTSSGLDISNISNIGSTMTFTNSSKTTASTSNNTTTSSDSSSSTAAKSN